MTHTVVLLHGWACDHHDMLPLAAALLAEHPVYTPDLRGHGGRPAPPDGYRIADLATDVRDRWLARGIRQPVVAGHSLGGAVAVELAAMGAVAGVLTLDAGWVYVRPAPHVVAGAADLHGPAFAERVGRLTAERARVHGHRGPFGTVPQHAGAAVFAGLMDWDGPARLGDCRVPVRAVFADRSRALLADAAPAGARFVAGTGHFVQIEAVDQVADAVRALCAETTTRTDPR